MKWPSLKQVREIEKAFGCNATAKRYQRELSVFKKERVIYKNIFNNGNQFYISLNGNSQNIGFLNRKNLNKAYFPDLGRVEFKTHTQSLLVRSYHLNYGVRDGVIHSNGELIWKKNYRSKDYSFNILNLSTGAYINLIRSKKTHNKKLIIMFHGGPESFELLDLRLGGLYQSLLDQGYALAIYNYSGSIFCGKEFRQRPWGKWKRCLESEFKELLKKLARNSFNKTKNIYLMGPSFGGTLALILSKSYAFAGAIALSPLLDLKNQMERAGKQRRWFKRRFSKQDINTFSFSHLFSESTTPQLVVLSGKDEVLGPHYHQEALSRSNLLRTVILQNSASHYPQPKQMHERILHIKRFLLEFT